MKENTRILTILAGPVRTNVYIIYHEDTREGLLIDPAEEAGKIKKKITELGIKPGGILLTHGHFDHMGAAEALKQEYGIKIYCFQEEEELLGREDLNLSAVFGRGFTLKADETFLDGQELKLSGFTIRVMHTPGHTKGSCCYYFEEEQLLFSGDTLFAESVGRTDFPTGDGKALARSIREKLFCLEEATPVYPGHNEATSIGHEKQYNPCV